MSAQNSSQDLFYQSHVFVCINQKAPGKTCCAGRNAEKLQKYMKARAKELGIEQTRINKAGCLNRCKLGPVMVIYPEGIWYRPENESDIDEILQSHLKEGNIVERLKLENED